MRSFRAVLLAIIATVTLVGGVASTADAKSDPHNPALAADKGPGATASAADPGDPGLPPD